ncbi:hypothetical protein BB559_001627 [Furculomyces boomerangus]|uniref:Uncharacterized protein n=1 Tax=Furculomyces boomerangus TaxID=61424 RepID=A0A2T9Z1B5_9FUNG|nr:hypothetical protein BB559_001627 [Furculomyces boomerangus]
MEHDENLSLDEAFLSVYSCCMKTEVVRLFLEYKFEIIKPHGKRMLEYAIKYKKLDLAGVLAEFDIIDTKNKSLFNDALSIGCTSVVEKYLQNEAFISKNLNDEFINLCYENQIDFVSTFLKYKASSKKIKKRMKVDSSDLKFSPYANIKNGKPLEIATEKENIEMINILLEYGAKPKPSNELFFLYSIKHKNINAINSYLEVLDLINQAHRDIVGEGLFQAVRYRHFDIYDSLITFLSEEPFTKKKRTGQNKEIGDRKSKSKENWISENVKNIPQNLKNNILQQTCNLGNVEYAKKAIEIGADINGIEFKVLFREYILDRIEVVDFLIGNGIDRQRIEEYEFIKACTEGDYDKVKKMISKGIDLNIYDGMILKQAGKSSNIKLVNFLLNKGAKPEKIVWNTK